MVNGDTIQERTLSVFFTKRLLRMVSIEKAMALHLNKSFYFHGSLNKTLSRWLAPKYNCGVSSVYIYRNLYSCFDAVVFKTHIKI